MTRTSCFILLSSLVLLLSNCSSRPDMVLSEDDMIDLLTDIHKSEAIIEMSPQNYRGDSIKAVVRQSVFAKHNVTQEEFDSSIVWYGHNVGKYIKIYDGVIARLEDEELELAQAESPKGVKVKRVKKRYPSSGDSADIWDKERSWVLQPQYRRNIIRFDFNQKPDDKNGDFYSLTYRLRNSINSVKVYLGADYYDGTTSFAYRSSGIEGDAVVKLQCDSTKRVKRIYGYISTDPSARENVFVDSIIMLRTRLDKDNYRLFDTQKWSGPRSLNPKAVKMKAAAEELKAAEELEKQKLKASTEAAGQGPRQRRVIPKPLPHKPANAPVKK